MDDLGKTIKSIREIKGITKSELARSINVSPAYITMLEKGTKKNPSIDILKKIANVLSVPLNELISSMKYDINYKLNNDVDFKIIKKYREEMKLSKEELCELIGIKLEDLEGIESGTIKNPRIDYAVRLNSLFNPNPPFYYCEEINGSLFDGVGILNKSLNDILNNGVYQSTNCRLDKKLILIDYIRTFATDRNFKLSTSETVDICNFLTTVIDPLLNHKLIELSKNHE